MGTGCQRNGYWLATNHLPSRGLCSQSRSCGAVETVLGHNSPGTKRRVTKRLEYITKVWHRANWTRYAKHRPRSPNGIGRGRRSVLGQGRGQTRQWRYSVVVVRRCCRRRRRWCRSTMVSCIRRHGDVATRWAVALAAAESRETTRCTSAPSTETADSNSNWKSFIENSPFIECLIQHFGELASGSEEL